jgi:fatty-acyl-CoA synthase
MRPGELPAHVAVDDVANIQYTSGTTGLPKGVMLTHHNIVNNGQFLAQGFHYTEQDKIVVPVPLFHCYGCVIGTMSAVNSGAAIMSAQLDLRPARHAEGGPRRARHQRLRRSRHVCGRDGAADFASYDLTSLRTGMMSGAPCPVELMKRVLDEMHCRELVIAYGQTETSPVVTMSDAGDSIEIRVKTVGRAMPQTEIRSPRWRPARRCPRGEQGEVCVRGYALMKGYDGDPEGTAQVINPTAGCTPATWASCARTAAST